jgi:hypothetical protein
MRLLSVFLLLQAAVVSLRLAGYIARSFRDEQLRHMMTGSIEALNGAGLVSFLDWVSLFFSPHTCAYFQIIELAARRVARGNNS